MTSSPVSMRRAPRWMTANSPSLRAGSRNASCASATPSLSSSGPRCCPCRHCRCRRFRWRRAERRPPHPVSSPSSSRSALLPMKSPSVSTDRCHRAGTHLNHQYAVIIVVGINRIDHPVAVGVGPADLILASQRKTHGVQAERRVRPIDQVGPAAPHVLPVAAGTRRPTGHTAPDWTGCTTSTRGQFIRMQDVATSCRSRARRTSRMSQAVLARARCGNGSAP